MTTRPRIVVEHTEGTKKLPVGFSAEPAEIDNPHVSLRVDFCLHDHARALKVLAEVVEQVRSQIIPED